MLFTSTSWITKRLSGASTPRSSCTAPNPSSASIVRPMQSSGAVRSW